MHFEDIEGYAIEIEGADDVLVERCTFATVGAAIRFATCTNVVVRDCAFWNIMGPSGAFVNNGVFVQAIACDGVLVEDCWGVNDPEVSNPEDILSMYQSIDVTFQRNRIAGHGPSLSATAINIGDGGGCEYGQALDNWLLYTGSGGVAVTGGDFMTVTGNRILNYEGAIPAWGGITVENFYDANCSAITVTDNEVAWYTAGGQVSALQDIDSDCGTIVETGNDWAATLTSDEWEPIGYYGWD